MLTANACPICGGRMVGDDVKWVQGGRILSRGGLSVQLSKNQAALFEFLWNRRNTATYYTIQRLTDHVYRDDPDGGPDGAAGCVHITIRRMRFRIAALGITISGARGRGGGYRMAYMNSGVH